jgi:signal peptidase
MLGSVVLLIAAAVGGMMLGLWRFAVIDTGSMRPTLNPGDVAVLTSEPTADLRKGQIVAFHPPGEPHLTVTHRAVSVEHTKNGVIVQTKGDANNARDLWRAHIVGRTVWHETFRLPKFGYLTVWSQQRLVRFGLLIVIVILIVSMQLGWIWRPSSR